MYNNLKNKLYLTPSHLCICNANLLKLEMKLRIKKILDYASIAKIANGILYLMIDNAHYFNVCFMIII